MRRIRRISNATSSCASSIMAGSSFGMAATSTRRRSTARPRRATSTLMMVPIEVSRKTGAIASWMTWPTSSSGARLGMPGSWFRLACRLAGAQLAVLAQHARHVGRGFAIGRDAVAVLRHRFFAGVVGGEHEIEVVAEEREEIAQVRRARADILLRIEHVLHAVAL